MGRHALLAATCACVLLLAPIACSGKAFSDLGKNRAELNEKAKKAEKDMEDKEREANEKPFRDHVREQFVKQIKREPTEKEVDFEVEKARKNAKKANRANVDPFEENALPKWSVQEVLAASRESDVKVGEYQDRRAANMTELSKAGLLNHGFAYLNKAPKNPGKLIAAWTKRCLADAVAGNLTDGKMSVEMAERKVVAIRFEGLASKATESFRAAMKYALTETYVDYFNFVLKDYFKDDDARNPKNKEPKKKKSKKMKMKKKKKKKKEKKSQAKKEKKEL